MLKIGVIGAGHLGKIHLRLLKEIKTAEVVGFFDHNTEIASKVEAEFGIRSFNNVEQLIDESEAIDIVTPTFSHYEYAVMAVRKSRHVFIEKPLTHTVDEGKKLISFIAEAGVKAQVGHVERFNPAFVAARDFLLQPLFIETHRLAEFNPRGTDVPVIYDLMIHDLDLALWLTGSEPVSWVASGSKLLSHDWDTCQLSMKMKNNICVSIQVSRIATQAARSIQVTQKESVLFANTGGLELSEVTADPGGMTAAEPMKIKNWSIEKKDALQEETNAFINAVKNKLQMPVTARDGLKAMKWIAEIEKDLSKQR